MASPGARLSDFKSDLWSEFQIPPKGGSDRRLPITASEKPYICKKNKDHNSKLVDGVWTCDYVRVSTKYRRCGACVQDQREDEMERATEDVGLVEREKTRFPGFETTINCKKHGPNSPARGYDRNDTGGIMKRCNECSKGRKHGWTKRPSREAFVRALRARARALGMRRRHRVTLDEASSVLGISVAKIRAHPLYHTLEPQRDKRYGRVSVLRDGLESLTKGTS